MRKGFLTQLFRWFLKFLGLGFLTGALVGARVALGGKPEKARSEVAKRLRELADRLERGGEEDEEDDEEGEA